MPDPAINRRALLGRAAMAAAAVAFPVVLGGCRAERPKDLTASPDVPVLTGVIAEEESLIALYEAALSTHSTLATRIEPLLAHHREHLTVLRRHLRPGTDGSTPTPTRTAGQTQIPDAPEQALVALQTAERRAASARIADVERVRPGIAQLLASIGASEAAHAAVLRGVQ